MTRLKPANLKDIQFLIDACDGQFREMGLELVAETDMAKWAWTMRSAPQTTGVNPSFDPEKSVLGPENAFWLGLLSAGETIACIANRLFVADDFVELIRTGAIWVDRHPIQFPEPINVVLPVDHVRISGRIGHHGGLWVRPDWRGRRLACILPRLTRAISMRQFDVDWHCGLTLEPLAKHRVPIKAYGYIRQELCVDGFIPVTNRKERVYLTSITREEILLQIAKSAVVEIVDFVPETGLG